MVMCWLLTFITIGVVNRLYLHGRPVVASTPPFALPFYLTCGTYALVFCQFMMFGVPAAYAQWWHRSSWVVFLALALTVIGWLIKTIVFLVAARPYAYFPSNEPRPFMIHLSMKESTIWFLLLWAWILCNPWLPFYACEVRRVLTLAN